VEGAPSPACQVAKAECQLRQVMARRDVLRLPRRPATPSVSAGGLAGATRDANRSGRSWPVVPSGQLRGAGGRRGGGEDGAGLGRMMPPLVEANMGLPGKIGVKVCSADATSEPPVRVASARARASCGARDHLAQTDLRWEPYGRPRHRRPSFPSR
jgi:hypothetical protein